MEENFEKIYSPENYAVIYARRSTSYDNYSIPGQINQGKNLLHQQGLLLYKIYEDEGVSATTNNLHERKGMVNLLEDVRAGKFKTVIVFRLDRLARCKTEHNEIRRIFKKHGTKVIYSEPESYQPDDSIDSELLEGIMMAVAELEPQNTNKRTSEGKERQWEAGRYDAGGMLPFGFDKGKNHKKVFLKKEMIPIIKLIFTLAKKIDGKYGATDILKEMNASPITQQLSKPLNVEKIISIIRNPIYGGYQPERNSDILCLFEKNPDGEYVLKNDLRKFTNVKTFTHKENAPEDAVDSPFMDKVDSQLWKDAVTQWRNHFKEHSSPRTNYLFRDLLLCSKCNKRIGISGAYYKCPSKKCFKVPEDKLNDYLLHQIIPDIFNESNIETRIADKILKNKEYICEKNKAMNLLIKYKHNLLCSYVEEPDNEYLKKEISKLFTEEKEIKNIITKYNKKNHSLRELFPEIIRIKELGTQKEVIEMLKSDSQVPLNLENIIAQKGVSIEATKLSKSEYEIEIKGVEYGT